MWSFQIHLDSDSRFFIIPTTDVYLSVFVFFQKNFWCDADDDEDLPTEDHQKKKNKTLMKNKYMKKAKRVFWF